MADRPVVSVVTPTLNQAAYLESTLASVRGQSYGPIEHIVVDGGSTDGTLALLQAAGDAGSIRWTSGPDRGMYDAINKGLATASGEILAYLNSDDAWFPWAVETAMAVFESRPDIDLVYGDGIKVDDGNGKQRIRLFPPFDRTGLASYESLMQPAVFWRRGLFERLGGFDRSLRFVADLDFWLRASEAGAGIAHVAEVLAVERIHPCRLSASQQEAMAAEDAAMRARHLGAAGGPAARDEARRRFLEQQAELLREFRRAARRRGVPFLRPGRWPKFLGSGRVFVRRDQLLLGTNPAHRDRLWYAVVSRLAAEIVGVPVSTEPPPPPPAPSPAPAPAKVPPAGRKPRPLPIRVARRVTPPVLRPAGRAVLRAARNARSSFKAWRFEATLGLTYRFSSEGRRSRRRLRELRNSVTERRAVIIGNGPSLNQMDLSVLRDVPTFGLNRGYLLFPRIGGPTTYLVSANRFVLEQSIDEMLAAPGPKFFNWRHRRFVPPGRDDVVFFHTVHEPGFSDDVAGRGLWEGATVTFVAMQLALHLGYRDVVIIGVDHSFTTPGPAHQLVTSQGADPNHFDPGYFGKGYRWQLPDLEMSEQAYRLAKEAYERAGGSIVDATVGGKLTIFPKADFTSLFPAAK